MDKRGIELSVNFLVGFVLAIVIFGFSITLVYTIFNEANTINDLTQDDIDNKIRALTCTARDTVCLSDNRQTYERGDLATIGIFIYNSADKPRTFEVEVTHSLAIDEDRKDINNNLTIAQLKDEIEIPGNSQELLGIGIGIPKTAPPGSYTFDIDVSPDGSQSVTRRKLTVNVQ